MKDFRFHRQTLSSPCNARTTMARTAANWTVALALNLVPAAWTVTDGNITGIACDYSAGNIASFYQCESRLGHNRAVCEGLVQINGTDVCTCVGGYGGWDDSCFGANCTYGTVAGCSTRMPAVYNLTLALCSVAMLVVTFVLGYALFVVWKGRAMCSRNVTSTTLLWLVLAATSLFLWVGTVLISTINGTWELMVR
jgi:hypothetical protein